MIVYTTIDRALDTFGHTEFRKLDSAICIELVEYLVHGYQPRQELREIIASDTPAGVLECEPTVRLWLNQYMPAAAKGSRAAMAAWRGTRKEFV